MKRLLLYFFALSLLTMTVPRIPRLFPQPEKTDDIHILHAADGTVYTLSAEDYVLGVMERAGYSYGAETMKAIAVALRSSVLYCEAVHPVHQNAAVCDDPRCCAAFSTEHYSEEWLQPVSETRGLVLIYDGSVACCPSCEDAGGCTASCEQSYGVSVAYLVSMPELFPCVPKRLSYAPKVIAELFGDEFLRQEPMFACDSSGRVREVRYVKTVLDGQRFADKLGLPSLLFRVETDGDSYTFVCFGSGDGVGLSRKGASRMEENGYDCREILAFYFPGTEIVSFL